MALLSLVRRLTCMFMGIFHISMHHTIMTCLEIFKKDYHVHLITYVIEKAMKLSDGMGAKGKHVHSCNLMEKKWCLKKISNYDKIVKRIMVYFFIPRRSRRCVYVCSYSGYII